MRDTSAINQWNYIENYVYQIWFNLHWANELMNWHLFYHALTCYIMLYLQITDSSFMGNVQYTRDGKVYFDCKFDLTIYIRIYTVEFRYITVQYHPKLCSTCEKYPRVSYLNIWCGMFKSMYYYTDNRLFSTCSLAFAVTYIPATDIGPVILNLA